MADWQKYLIGGAVGGGIASAGFLLLPPSAASSAENLYAAAQEDGALLSACLYAGQVAEAWGAAGNSEMFSVWKATERSDCAQAELARRSHSSLYR